MRSCLITIMSDAMTVEVVEVNSMLAQSLLHRVIDTKSHKWKVLDPHDDSAAGPDANMVYAAGSYGFLFWLLACTVCLP